MVSLASQQNHDHTVDDVGIIDDALLHVLYVLGLWVCGGRGLASSRAYVLLAGLIPSAWVPWQTGLALPAPRSHRFILVFQLADGFGLGSSWDWPCPFALAP